jgi:cytoskeleton protein RodZ
LPLEEDKPRLKLSIEDNDSRNQEDPIQELDEISGADDDEELSVGAHLRRERERQGLSLHDVAEKLRLRAKQLQALEEGDYESLPGQTFVTGFIRSYASTLRLDAVAVVNLYKRENDIGRTAPDLAFPEPTPEGRMPGMGLLMGSGLVALLLFAGWYFYYKDNAPDLEIVQELPQRLLEKITGSNDDLPEATEDAGAANVVADLTEGSAVPSSGPAAVEALKPEITSNKSSEELAVVEPSAADDVSDQAGTDVVPEKKNTTDANETAPIDAVENASEADTSSSDEAASAVSERSTEEITSGSMSSAPDANISDTEVSPNNETLSAENVKTPLPTDNAAEGASVDQAASTETEQPTVETEASDAPAATGFQQLTLPEQTPPAAAKERSDAEPVTLGMENATARLVLVANQESWVQVTSATGETILDRIMEAGDTFMLPNGPALTLSTANGSGLELRLDGEVLGTLGAYGQIVRNLSLEPEALKEKFGAEN